MNEFNSDQLFAVIQSAAVDSKRLLLALQSRDHADVNGEFIWWETL